MWKGNLVMVEKEKRIQLFENENVILEQRGSNYYLSLYDNNGKFQREVKKDFKVSLSNDSK